MFKYPIKQLLREPLFHFLVLGVGIFIAYDLQTETGNDGPENIVVTQGQISAMAVGFSPGRLHYSPNPAPAGSPAACAAAVGQVVRIRFDGLRLGRHGRC